MLPLVLRSPWPFVLSALVSACAATLPPPETPPAVVAAQDVVPPAGDTRLTLRLSVPLAGVEALARQHLVLPRADDFVRVSAAGANPEVEARYAASLASLGVRGRRDALEVRADVDYHATLRARAKTPFGRIWLTKGTAWGTAAKPGHMQITLRSRMAVEPDWQLRSHTELSGVKLRAPDMKKVCSRGAFSICVDPAWVEGEIHRRLEAAVRGKVQAALADLDRDLAERVPLRDGAASLWKGLLEQGARVGLVPVALAVGAPAVHGESLGLDLRVAARPRSDDDSKAGPLPRARRTLDGDDELPLRVSLDWAALGELFAGSLPRTLEGQPWAWTGLEVRGAAEGPGRYWVAVRLTQGEREREVHLSARLEGQGENLVWQDPEWSAPSARWLDEVGLGQALLREVGDLRADVGGLLRAQVERVISAFASAAGLWPVRPVALDAVELQGVYATDTGVVLTGVAR